MPLLIDPTAGSNNRHRSLYPSFGGGGSGPIIAPQHGSYGGTADPSYLPLGYQAPSPQYIDSMNRVGENSAERVFRRQNFYNSVAKNNATATQSAGDFAAGKSAGLDDATARRRSFVLGHGGGEWPLNDAAPVPPTPSTYVVTGGGSRAAGPGVVQIPGGSNVVTPGAGGAGAHGTGTKPYNDQDRSIIQERYLGKPVVRTRYKVGADGQVVAGPDGKPLVEQYTEYSKKPGVEMRKAEEEAAQQAEHDMAGPGFVPPLVAAPGAPAAGSPAPATTRPSSPGVPASPQVAPGLQPITTSGGKGNIPMTLANARMMWDVLQQQHGTGGALAEQAFRQKMNEYGVDPADSEKLVAEFMQNPTQQQQPGQGSGAATAKRRGPRTPLSRMGTDNGLDYSQNNPGTAPPYPTNADFKMGGGLDGLNPANQAGPGLAFEAPGAPGAAPATPSTPFNAGSPPSLSRAGSVSQQPQRDSIRNRKIKQNEQVNTAGTPGVAGTGPDPRIDAAPHGSYAYSEATGGTYQKTPNGWVRVR